MRSTIAVVSYTWRACLPARRRLGLVLFAVVALLFGLLAHVPPGTAEDAFAGVAAVGLFGLVLPLATLVVGDSVLGAEVRQGTFAFTWLSPVSLAGIGLGRWLGGWVAAASIVVPAFALAAVVGGAPAVAGAVALGAAAGSAAYVALFVAIGVVARRAVAVSLVVVFLIERLLGSVLTGIAQLSPGWEAGAVFTGLAEVPADLVRDGIPSGWSAVGRLTVLTVVALGVAVWRLGHLRLGGASD